MLRALSKTHENKMLNYMFYSVLVSQKSNQTSTKRNRWSPQPWKDSFPLGFQTMKNHLYAIKLFLSFPFLPSIFSTTKHSKVDSSMHFNRTKDNTQMPKNKIIKTNTKINPVNSKPWTLTPRYTTNKNSNWKHKKEKRNPEK